MDSFVWVVLAAVLGVAEIFTLTAALGLVPAAQFAVFAAVSIGLLIGVRPLVKRQLRPRYGPQHRFGVAALVGRQARVVQEVTGHAGRVRIGGEEWSARAYDESLVIPAGTTVDVIQIEGATALVYPRE